MRAGEALASAVNTRPTSLVAMRRELWAWSGVAVGAIAVAGLFAFLLALSRVPGIEDVFPWPLGFFHKGLIIHVVFSFVVWFLAVFGVMALLASDRLADGGPRRDGLGLVAVGGTAVAMPMLFVPALLDRGEPTLNNYVPVIIDPLYYAGLAVLAISVGTAAVRVLSLVSRSALRRCPDAASVAAAAVIVLLALLCFGLALRALAGTPWSFDYNEWLTWGGGHVLQFGNTLLLVTVWASLAARAGGAFPLRALLLASAMLLLGALPAPSFYFAFPSFSPEQMRAFTWLQYLLGPPALIVAVAALAGLRRPWPWREPAFLTLALSMLLFAVGGSFGMFVDGHDTRTPAHYHGVIAAVTLAFFGLFFGRVLPLLGRAQPSARRQRTIVHLFAWGQLAACVGLFVAGGHGAPRKVAGEAQGLTDWGAIVGMGLNGLGGLIAIVGGALFVWTVGALLLRPADPERHASTVDLRPY